MWEGTWLPFRELLKDHLNEKKTTETKNVRFNETIKTFTYDNKDSNDEFEMHTNDDFDTEMDNMTVKNETNDGVCKITKYKHTYNRDDTLHDTTKPETKRKAIHKHKNKILSVDSDIDDDHAEYTGKRATPEFHLSVLRLRSALETKEKLKGSTNYNPWKQKILMILCAEGLDKFIKTDLKDVWIDPAIRSRTNAAVYKIIHTNLAKNVQSLIANIPVAVDAWRKLEQIYSSKSTDKIITSIDGLRYSDARLIFL